MLNEIRIPEEIKNIIVKQNLITKFFRIQAYNSIMIEYFVSDLSRLC